MACGLNGELGSYGHERGREMHGGLPFIGFSTIVYGAVGLTTVVGHAIMKLWGRP